MIVSVSVMGRGMCILGVGDEGGSKRLNEGGYRGGFVGRGGCRGLSGGEKKENVVDLGVWLWLLGRREILDALSLRRSRVGIAGSATGCAVCLGSRARLARHVWCEVMMYVRWIRASGVRESCLAALDPDYCRGSERAWSSSAGLAGARISAVAAMSMMYRTRTRSVIFSLCCHGMICTNSNPC